MPLSARNEYRKEDRQRKSSRDRPSCVRLQALYIGKYSMLLVGYCAGSHADELHHADSRCVRMKPYRARRTACALALVASGLRSVRICAASAGAETHARGWRAALREEFGCTQSPQSACCVRGLPLPAAGSGCGPRGSSMPWLHARLIPKPFGMPMRMSDAAHL